MIKTHCRNGHELTEDNVRIENGRGKNRTYRCIICRRASDKRNKAKRVQAQREKRAANAASPFRKEDGGVFIRYQYDWWCRGRTLYVKVTAIEYERAEYEDFRRQARRKAVSVLERHGIDTSLPKGIGGLIEWDRSKNWADLLTESITFEMAKQLPRAIGDDEDAAAA